MIMKLKLRFCFIFLSFFSSWALAQKKPNVLFIMTDQQTYRMMSCMGSKWLKTPNMDKIAAMGYRFEKAYTVNPVCMPSRFSILTGHYASEVGVKENTRNFNAEKVSQIIAKDALGNLFKKAGYQTLYSGKTHLYGTKDVSEYGFTLNSLDPYDGPAIYAEKALAQIGEDKNARPFFMFLSFLNPHDICYKAGMDKRYPDKLPVANIRETERLLAIQKNMPAAEYQSQIPPRAFNGTPINGEAPDMVSMDIFPRAWNNDQLDLYNWMYHRLTESVDRLIGRVLIALDKSGMKNNTIIVFSSDHGDMNGAHGLILKNVMFEECQRIPLIFAGKGIKSNYVDKSALVCNGLDFIPTICDLVGIDAPKNLPGVSLKPLLTGEKKQLPRKYLFTEDYNAFQINDGRYKYTIYELPGNPDMLTDLQINPGETINYSNVSAYADIKSRLKKILMANLTRRGLTPLAQDRTIENIRKIEVEKLGKDKSGETDN
jgi:choline-sulfatase